MAVYTRVSPNELDRWLSEHVGLRLKAGPEVVTEGIENTNYRFWDEHGDCFMFTILEVWSASVAEHCLRLARHLYEANQPVPETLRLRNGNLFAPYADKPASVVRFIPGVWRVRPSSADCRVIGTLAAHLHAASGNFRATIPNQRGFDWRQAAANRVRPQLEAASTALLAASLRCDQRCHQDRTLNLPAAACHCDMFRNNVLWSNEAVSGVIDFYFAGVESLLFDLCVIAVDWCINDEGVLAEDNLAALLDGYQSQRQLASAERALVPAMLVSAALRFWLSRLDDYFHPRQAEVPNIHDPNIFRNRIKSCLELSSELVKNI